MKSIILIAFFCATALAIPAKPTKTKTNLVEIFATKVAPKLTSLQTDFHKITRANLYNLLEDNDKPGLREVVDQFFDSVEVIYNLVNRAADRLVPLFRKYNLNEIIEAKLSLIVQKASTHALIDLVQIIRILQIFVIIREDVDVVKLFIVLGIYASTVHIPYYTYEELSIVIRSVSTEAEIEFYDVCSELLWNSVDEGLRFANVLYDALVAEYDSK